MPVRVENDLVNRSDVTVRIVAADGYSSFLGGAPPAGTRTFNYRVRSETGTYQLTASTGDGRLLYSRSFTLFPGVAVTWSLRQNILQVVSRELLEPPPDTAVDRQLIRSAPAAAASEGGTWS